MRFRFLTPLLLLAPALAFAQAATPELPRVVPAFQIPAPTRVLAVHAGDNLQAALDSARGGDAIELACGATFRGNFTLAAKPDTGWITVRPSCASQLPGAGTRMTPALAASLALPRLVAPNALAVLATVPAAHRYRITGLELTIDSSVTFHQGLILFGSGGTDQPTVASMARDLVIDHVYAHGTPATSLKRCLAINSGATVVADSYLSECHGSGLDAQAILGYNGTGPYLIENNYLEGSGENIMFGGADPTIPQLVPSDITIRHNYFRKPAAWLGGPWTIKNLFELKSAERLLLEGNVLDGNWANGQDGTALVLKSSNQDGACTWCVSRDITVRHNIWRNIGSPFAIAALNASEQFKATPASHFALIGNLFTNVNAPGYAGGARSLLMSSLTDVTISHNTILYATTAGNSAALLFVGTAADTMRGIVITANVWEGGTYAVMGDAIGVGTKGIAHYAPDAVFAGNVLVLHQETAGPPSLYPSGNAYPPSVDSIRLTSDPIPRLSATSPYKAAPGQLDPGVLADTLLAFTAGAESGQEVLPTPVPTPTPTPTPGPIVAALTLDQLRAAITALDKATGPSGRENQTVKAALVPVDVYLKALLAAVTAH